MKKKIAIGASSFAVILAVTSYFSPHFTVYQMKRAIENQDAESFSDHVDFPGLKESLKAQFLAQIAQSESTDNPFSALGQMMAIGMLNQMLDTMISPSGVMVMMKNVDPNPKTALPDQSGSRTQSSSTPDTSEKRYSIRYKNWSRVYVTPGDSAEAAGGFIFKRDGLWGWKLAGLDIPKLQTR